MRLRISLFKAQHVEDSIGIFHNKGFVFSDVVIHFSIVTIRFLVDVIFFCFNPKHFSSVYDKLLFALKFY